MGGTGLLGHTRAGKVGTGGCTVWRVCVGCVVACGLVPQVASVTLKRVERGREHSGQRSEAEAARGAEGTIKSFETKTDHDIKAFLLGLAWHGAVNKSHTVTPTTISFALCLFPQALSRVISVERNRNTTATYTGRGDFQSSSFSSTFAFSDSSAFGFAVSEPPAFAWFSALAASSLAAAATHAGAPAKAPMQEG